MGSPAGFWIRVAAYFIDAVILNLAMWLVIGVLGFLPLWLAETPIGMFVATPIAILLSLAYVIHLPATRNATPGKKILGLRIVREDGVEPLGYGTAILRLVGYMISGFILYIGFLMVAFTEDKRGLHDMIAKTRVVKTR